MQKKCKRAKVLLFLFLFPLDPNRPLLVAYLFLIAIETKFTEMDLLLLAKLIQQLQHKVF
jgi:hypothetical protein